MLQSLFLEFVIGFIQPCPGLQLDLLTIVLLFSCIYHGLYSLVDFFSLSKCRLMNAMVSLDLFDLVL